MQQVHGRTDTARGSARAVRTSADLIQRNRSVKLCLTRVRLCGLSKKGHPRRALRSRLLPAETQRAGGLDGAPLGRPGAGHAIPGATSKHGGAPSSRWGEGSDGTWCAIVRDRGDETCAPEGKVTRPGDKHAQRWLDEVSASLVTGQYVSPTLAR